MVKHNGYTVGDRWADVRYGYVPIGFFQLWNQAADHRHGIRLRRYPDNHQTAARADVKFALQWDRRAAAALTGSPRGAPRIRAVQDRCQLDRPNHRAVRAERSLPGDHDHRPHHRPVS